MAHVDGRIFWDPALPELSRAERAPVYDAMNAALAELHAIDVAAAGLSDFGKPGSYFARQLQRWSEQYRASETARLEDMERLIDWLRESVPADDGRVALVHGDWRIDNMIFDAHAPKLLAVLDWELSTLGHPFADLAYQCMQWRLPNAGAFRGLGGVDRLEAGIPTEDEYVAAYCRRAGLDRVPDWTFLIAFSFFRVAAIVQGVYKRSLDGNASNPERARAMGAAVPLMAKLAMQEVEGGAGRLKLGEPRDSEAPCGARRAAVLSAPRPRLRVFLRRLRPRRGGRVVDRAALEMRSTCKRTGGSNPLPLRQ